MENKKNKEEQGQQGKKNKYNEQKQRRDEEIDLIKRNLLELKIKILKKKI